MPNSSIRKAALEAVIVQFADDIPLTQRRKTQERLHSTAVKLTTELNEEAWNKAKRLVNGKWCPFSNNRLECFAPRKFGNPAAMGSPRMLMYEFKKAVLSQNWSNALKIANCIFTNYHSFIQRSHIKVMLTLLLSHPGINETVISDLCSFLWKLEDSKTKSDFLQCFCSLPKSIPSEPLREVISRKSDVNVFKISKGGHRSPMAIKYTAHIGQSEENTMYVE